VVVLAVAAVVGVLLLGGSHDPQTPDGSPTSTSTSPAGRTFAATAGTSTAPVVQRPTAVAVAAGSVWATSYRSHRVVRMDAASLTRRPSSATIPVGTTDMTADGSSLWLVSEQSDTLTRVDARTGRVVGTPLVLPPGNPFAVAADGTSVWVGSRGSRNRNPVQQVLKVDKASMRVTAEIPVSRGVIDVAVGDDAVWVTNTRGSSVTRIAKRTAQQQEIRVGSQPKGVAVGGGGVWVANSGDGTVSRVDEGDGFRVATRAVGSAPQLITFGDGGAWVTLRDDSEVVRLDTRARVTARVPVETNPFALSIGGSRVYVASLYGDVVQAVAPEAG
jgi:hypothetical protein